MSRASINTLLSLDRYATVMGIPPPYFNGAVFGTLFATGSGCASDVWYQYPWQKFDKCSREELAQCIKSAEDDIKRIIHFSPAPEWVTEEVQAYPQHYRSDYFGGVRNNRWQDKSVQTDYRKVIGPGIRALTPILTATTVGGSLVYQDLDGDGYSETATIAVPTTLTDLREIKVYHFGHDAEPEWEIRPARSKVLIAGNAVIKFWAWQLVDSDIWETLTTDASPTDATVAANLATMVEVYREYNNATAVSAQFIWEPGVYACAWETYATPVGSLTFQDGVFTVRDAESGTVIPVPASYDAVDAEWDSEAYTMAVEPNMVKLWYYAGDIDQRYLKSKGFDPLSDFWAQTIAMVATARLERQPCGCGCSNVEALYARYRIDLADSKTNAYMIDFNSTILSNPLGTRYGEVMAWKRISQLVPRLTGAAV